MSFVTRILAVWALAFCAATAAFGQGAVLQGGPSTAGRAPMYSTTGQGGQTVVQDSGPASGGAAGLGLKELLLVKRGTGTPPIANQGTGPLNTTACMYDAPINNAAGYHYLCLDPNAQGGGLLAYGAGGTASTLPFQLSINGVLYTLPFSVGGIVGPNSSTIGDLACWNGTGGNILADCSQATVAGYINIKRPPYNAACDGTTDDAAAFNSARLALQAAGGGTIFVPGGICIVGSATALFFTSGDIAIEGAGPGSVIKAKNSAALANLVTTSSAVTSFSLRNVTLDGNKANAGTNPSPTSYVLLPQNRKVRISGAEIRNAARVGLAFGPGSADIEIVTSYFHDNEIEAITNVGAPAPDDVRIVNNRFENNYITTTIGDSGAINLIATNFNVSLNYFLNNYNVNGGQLAISDGASGTVRLDGIIAENIVEQTGTVAGEKTAGIEVNGSYVGVRNNQVRNANYAGIRIEGDSIGNLLSGNTVSSQTTNGIETIIGGGANGPRKIAIRGNHIMGAGIAGISLQNTVTSGNDVVLQDNYIDASVPTPINGVANASVNEGNTRGDWQNWTPTISSATGAPGSFGITSARYVRGASKGELTVRLAVTTVAPATGFITISLPFSIAGPCAFAGIDANTQKAANGYASAGGGNVAIYRYDGALPVGNGSDLIVSGTCQLN
jgi:hypothetical protein